MLMRWCEFIAGFGSAVAWPLVRGYAARALYEDLYCACGDPSGLAETHATLIPRSG